MSRPFVLLALFGFGAAALLGPLVVLLRADQGGAAFGDSEVFEAATLSSSTVEVRPGDRSLPITSTNLAPGSRVSGVIEVVNSGTLAVRYSLISESTDDPLLEWVQWELWPGTSADSCSGEAVASPLFSGSLLGGLDADAVVIIGDPTPGPDPDDRIIEAGATDLLCVAVILDIDAPDGMQGRSVDQRFVVKAEQHIEEPLP